MPFTQVMGYRSTRCEVLWDYFVWVCRLWGIITAIGLWGVGAETCYHKHILGAYILAAAVVMSFLETVFFINFCVVICVREDQRTCIAIWRAVLWVDNWRKGLLYAVMGGACFIRPHRVWMAVISGVMMMISAFFYFIKTYKVRRDERLAEREKAQTYDSVNSEDDDEDHIIESRFEVPDDLDDPIVENGGPSAYGEETLAEQEEILEV